MQRVELEWHGQPVENHYVENHHHKATPLAPANQKSNRSLDRPDDNSFNSILMEIVGPILIMLMVGSLVFFLIEVFYRGPHALRLGWVLGLFTTASVLVGRISILEGFERASLFGFALAAATLYATVKIVDFEYGALFFLEPVVVILLISIVMWSTNRLTWDCTLIDSSRDVSAIGIAELVKRRLVMRNTKQQKSRETPDNNSANKGQSNSSTAKRLQFLLFANSSTQNTPGLWVFYFALAALPIFGFGQWFSQPDSTWGYRWIFMLFAIYLGSALGLLMLTSLLGLNRYLHKRGASMPRSVSVNWLVVGTVFALLMMLVVLLLPSPSLSNGLQNTLAFLTTNSKQTSVHAVGNDGQPGGDNPKNQVQDQDAKGAQQKPGDQGAGQGDQGKGGDKQSESKGKDSSGKKKSNNRTDSKNQSKTNNKSAQDQKSKQGDRSAEKSESESKRQQETESNDQADKKNSDDPQKQNQPNDNSTQDKATQDKAKQDNRQAKAQPARKTEKPPNEQDRQVNRQRGDNQNAQPPQPSNNRPPSRLMRSLGQLVKFVIYGIGLVALMIAIWMFRHELARLWADLFGKKNQPKAIGSDRPSKRSSAKSLPRFSAYNDPFSRGVADKWTAAQTIEYSFEALEAWARDHGCPRGHDQTLIEFSKQLHSVDADVAGPARQLADLMGESLYSGGAVERSETLKLQVLWQAMGANLPVVNLSASNPGLQLISQS